MNEFLLSSVIDVDIESSYLAPLIVCKLSGNVTPARPLNLPVPFAVISPTCLVIRFLSSLISFIDTIRIEIILMLHV